MRRAVAERLLDDIPPSLLVPRDEDYAQYPIFVAPYGADIGRLERRQYEPVTGVVSRFVSGYTPLPGPRS